MNADRNGYFCRPNVYMVKMANTDTNNAEGKGMI